MQKTGDQGWIPGSGRSPGGGSGNTLQCSFLKKPKARVIWHVGETVETVADFIFGVPKPLQMVTAAMKLKDTYSLEGKL